jgi:single-strand DNA-binding protein
MNKVILCGHVGQAPELRQTQAGKSVANFSIATNDGGKDKPPTWHRIVVWEKLAENCAKYLEKGRQVLIDGRIQVSQYEKDGEKRTSVEIVAFSVQFLGGGKNEGEKTERKQEPEPQPSFDNSDIPF